MKNHEGADEQTLQSLRSKWNPFRNEALSVKQAALAVAMIFVFAGVFGWVYEELFYRINDGFFSWRGHRIGPWLPIYAFGMVIILFLTAPVKDYKWKVVLLCALISGSLEFLVGWALYYFYDGLRLWDYNVEIWNWGNIGGFICFRSVLFFTVSGSLLLYTIVPLIGQMAKRLPGWAYGLIAGVPFVLFIIDIIYALLFSSPG